MVGDGLEQAIGLGRGAHQDALTKLQRGSRVLGVAVPGAGDLLTIGAVKCDVADALAGEAKKEISFRHGYEFLVVFDLPFGAFSFSDGSANLLALPSRSILMRFDTLIGIGRVLRLNVLRVGMRRRKCRQKFGVGKIFVFFF